MGFIQRLTAADALTGGAGFGGAVFDETPAGLRAAGLAGPALAANARTIAAAVSRMRVKLTISV